MANVKGLNLEFETEDDLKKKKEAIDVDVDSLFSSGQTAVQKNPVQKQPQPQNPSKSPNPNPGAQVRNINEAKSSSGNKEAARPQSGPPVSSSSSDALQIEVFRDMREEIKRLQSEVLELKTESKSKEAINEFKLKFLVEFMSNSKLLDSQLNQSINKIAAKVPALKNELLQMKKYLQEFNKKTEDLKNDSTKK